MIGMKKERIFTLEAELEVPLKKLEVQTLSVKADSLENAKGAVLARFQENKGLSSSTESTVIRPKATILVL